MSRAPDRRTASGSRQFLAGDVPELSINWTAGVTLTDQAAAISYFNQDNGNIMLVDLDAFEQVRLTVRVKTVSASAASPRIRLGYNTTLQTTAANVLQIGRTTQVEGSIFTGTTLSDSGWLDLVAAAQIKNCFLSLMMIGGDAAADPVVGQIQTLFR